MLQEILQDLTKIPKIIHLTKNLIEKLIRSFEIFKISKSL